MKRVRREMTGTGRSAKAIVLACAAALALALALALAGEASARAGQQVTFEAPRELLDSGPDLRAETFEELDGLGVRALRIVMYWRNVAPEKHSRIRPEVDLADPAVYDWSRYAPAIEEAQRRGWTVQLTVSGPSPRWATSGARDPGGVKRPSPKQFRRFMTAVSRRFGGAVARYAIWNEPNHPEFLKPQFDARLRPVAPTIYRRLYVAALQGLKDAGDTKPVLMGETSPSGRTGRAVGPAAFLRGALCLRSDGKRRRGCRQLRVDGWAHHPYTRATGPLAVPPRHLYTIAVLPRLTKLLDRAAKARSIKRRTPLYLTEFGMQSYPDTLSGVPLRQQNEFRAMAEKIAYENPRVRAFSQYLMRDDQPSGSGTNQFGGFESGLRTAGGRRKPAFDGFRLPLVAERRGTRVRLWGLVRPARSATTARIERRTGSGSWRRLASRRTDARGVFARWVSDRAGAQWRISWTAPDGTTHASPGVRAYRWPASLR